VLSYQFSPSRYACSEETWGANAPYVFSTNMDASLISKVPPARTSADMKQASIVTRSDMLPTENRSTRPAWTQPETKYYKVGETGGLYAVPCRWLGEPGMHLRHYVPTADNKVGPCGGLWPTKDGVHFRLEELMNLRDYAPQITRWVRGVEGGSLLLDTTHCVRHGLSRRVVKPTPMNYCHPGLLPTPPSLPAELRAKNELYVELMPPAQNPAHSPLHGRYVRITRYGQARNVVNLRTREWNDLAGYMVFICDVVATFSRPDQV
jgi:hypothetical protein